MPKITLQTGVKITHDKNGNIISLISPYDKQKTYGEKCVDDLKAIFKGWEQC
jgi:hypothetical protein